MEAYQPSCAGPVFRAVNNKMVRVKEFRWYRFKFNVYQFGILYFGPIPCTIAPILVFQKQSDWVWWVALLSMINFWIWVGGILLSTFVTAWVLGMAHGVRQR